MPYIALFKWKLNREKVVVTTVVSLFHSCCSYHATTTADYMTHTETYSQFLIIVIPSTILSHTQVPSMLLLTCKSGLHMLKANFLTCFISSFFCNSYELSFLQFQVNIYGSQNTSSSHFRSSFSFKLRKGR